jgi:hypothetical protein
MRDTSLKATMPNDQRGQARAATIEAAKRIGAQFSSLTSTDRALLVKCSASSLFLQGVGDESGVRVLQLRTRIGRRDLVAFLCIEIIFLSTSR